jgi:hypothetical protein
MIPTNGDVVAFLGLAVVVVVADRQNLAGRIGRFAVAASGFGPLALGHEGGGFSSAVARASGPRDTTIVGSGSLKCLDTCPVAPHATTMQVVVTPHPVAHCLTVKHV